MICLAGLEKNPVFMGLNCFPYHENPSSHGNKTSQPTVMQSYCWTRILSSDMLSYPRRVESSDTLPWKPQDLQELVPSH